MITIEKALANAEVVPHSDRLPIQIRSMDRQHLRAVGEKSSGELAHLEGVIDAIVGLRVTGDGALGHHVEDSLASCGCRGPISVGKDRGIGSAWRKSHRVQALQIGLLARIKRKVLQPPEVFEQLSPSAADRQSYSARGSILLQLQRTV